MHENENQNRHASGMPEDSEKGHVAPDGLPAPPKLVGSDLETQKGVPPPARPNSSDDQSQREVSPPLVDRWWGNYQHRPQQEASDPLIDSRLGNYHLLSLLGSGGFGKVYLAEDVSLGRKAVVKFLHDSLDSRQIELFGREAKALAALSKHPAVVEIYEWGTNGDQPHFVMEYVEGTAQRLLKENPSGVPVATALRICLECASALAEAHELGILHRDVKTANILIEKGGQAKLADFGLVHLKAQGESLLAGAVVGSPDYMSPEQASGQPLDARTDIFSLGVTLYELLSGQRPYAGNSTMELLRNIRHNTRVPLAERRPDLSSRICHIVEKATAHTPDKRYSSAGELVHELRVTLDTLERTGEVSEAVALPESRRGLLTLFSGLGAAFVVVALIAGALVWGWAPGGGTEESNTLQMAKAHMDEGAFAAAADAYAHFFNTEVEENTGARYGLSLACIALGRLDEGQAHLERVSQPELKREGMAVLEFERNGVSARRTLEGTVSEIAAPYPKVLLSKIDIMERKYGEVVERLRGLSSQSFRFGYQYADAMQTIGQAHFRLDDLANARKAFQALDTAAIPGRAAVAQGYLKQIAGKLDAKRRSRVIERAGEIRKLIGEGVGQQDEEGLWASRPLSFFVLPVEVRGSTYAVDSGLADLLPLYLEDALQAETPMLPLERGLMQEILDEQALSAMVSKDEGQLALGRVMGARLLLQCTFSRLGSTERLTVRAVDIERTTRVPVEKMRIDGGTDPEGVVSTLAKAVWSGVRQSFPLRARLYVVEEHAMINVGTELGVSEGMLFDAFVEPDATAIPGVTISVSRDPGARTAYAVITGRDLKLPSSPEVGLYVRERTSVTAP